MSEILAFLQKWGLPFFGIILTVGIFIYQSRQRTGADTERRTRANQELTDLLVKRLILENYYPPISELIRIRDGLATKFSMDPEDLISDEALENSVFYSVIANDYIEPTKRTEILTKVRTTNSRAVNHDQIYALQQEKTSDPSAADFGAKTLLKVLSNSLITDAFSSLVLGGLVVGAISILLMPKLETTFLGQLSYSFKSIVVPIIFVSGTLILVASYLAFQRNKKEKLALDRVSLRSEVVGTSVLDFRVRYLLENACRQKKLKSLEKGTPTNYYDYVIEKANGERIAIKVRHLRRPLKSLLDRWIDRLVRDITIESIQRGIVVLPDEAAIPSDVDGKGISIMTAAEFEKYINGHEKID